ncbi:hypothetical protein PEC18_05035 [Paucibacter sp. O1-1]|nr:hypothetical protein [Paucibacter sp. O1-1]MDA3825234.1 hypothetical protein [Paucibacter sp. O1-1]
MDSQAPGFNLGTTDPARRVFEHWLFVNSRNPRRCKMGPTRRMAIQAALAMGYDTEMLMAAVEGMAADPLDAVGGESQAARDRMRDAMREIEWLMAREARIERWAEKGDALRALVALPPPAAEPLAPAVDPAAEAAARARLLARIQAQRQGGRHG